MRQTKGPGPRGSQGLLIRRKKAASGCLSSYSPTRGGPCWPCRAGHWPEHGASHKPLGGGGWTTLFGTVGGGLHQCQLSACSSGLSLGLRASHLLPITHVPVHTHRAQDVRDSGCQKPGAFAACQSPSSTTQKLSVPHPILSTILSPGNRKPILQMKKTLQQTPVVTQLRSGRICPVLPQTTLSTVLQSQLCPSEPCPSSDAPRTASTMLPSLKVPSSELSLP